MRLAVQLAQEPRSRLQRDGAGFRDSACASQRLGKRREFPPRRVVQTPKCPLLQFPGEAQLKAVPSNLSRWR